MVYVPVSCEFDPKTTFPTDKITPEKAVLAARLKVSPTQTIEAGDIPPVSTICEFNPVVIAPVLMKRKF